MLPSTKHATVLNPIAEFFTGKARTYGATPAGADFNSASAQEIRFDQVTKLIACGAPFSILDYGCGYGALYEYLRRGKFDMQAYTGFDISEQMVREAKERFGGDLACVFTDSEGNLPVTDYVIASGIFNVKLNANTAEWESFVRDTIDRIASLSRRGFAFNMLTSYSDLHRKRPDLYYGNPCWYFDYCKTRWSRNVALLHDYQLYDWTILVRLDDPTTDFK